MIDTQLEELLARARALLEQDPEGDAGGLGAALLDFDAAMRGGHALPVAWRDPATASRVDVLLWLCRRVWSRCTASVDEVRIRETRMANPATRWAVVGGTFPRMVVGPTPEDALRLAVSWGIHLATRLHGDDATARDAWTRLSGLGLEIEPAATFDRYSPFDPACRPNVVTHRVNPLYRESTRGYDTIHHDVNVATELSPRPWRPRR